MVVSHSRVLAEAAVELAREMVAGQDVRVEVAAGLEDGGLGTDAVAIVDALSAADRGDGVVVLMDLGSAVLSAELALELLDEEQRERVLLCPAPLVEGLVAACVSAGGGAARNAVADEALAALAGKQSHLTGPAPAPPSADLSADAHATVVVSGPHGLHARPAARLVQQAMAGDARVEVRNATTGSRWVSAASLSQVATLGALSGHELELRASGPGAAQVVAELVQLAARGFDEGPTAVPPVDPHEPQASRERPGRVVAASPGVAIGPTRQWRAAGADTAPSATGDPESERTRLTAALDRCRQELRAVRARAAAGAGESSAAIFDAHLLLLADEDLLSDAFRRISTGEPAPSAWTGAVQRVHDGFASLPDPYLRSRAADVEAVGEQVRRALLGGPGTTGLELLSGVLVAPDLTPAEAVALDPRRILGVVLARGSATAHSAILVRSLGLPAVAGAGAAVLDVPDGTLLALDGATGELVVDPDDAVLQRLGARAAQLAEAAGVAASRAAEPARTRDGAQVHLGANVSSLDDAQLAADVGADLAGLVRTEFLFLSRDRAPDVDEQEAVYRSLAEALGGRRVVLRTLDVGGDKPLPYVRRPAESNPFLGVRGLRLALAVPGLLADQLLAMVRVARDAPVSVMFPMVTTVAELLQARTLLDAAVTRAGGGRPADLRVGMMVEVPAAALKTTAFAPHVDFLSIGTNDLAQYALATERGNTGVAALSDPYDPGVLRLIRAVCTGAGDALVAVCGELAADPAATELLIGLGVRELSVSPRAVPAVKQAVRAVDSRSAGRVASRALDLDGPGAVRALLGASVST